MSGITTKTVGNGSLNHWPNSKEWRKRTPRRRTQSEKAVYRWKDRDALPSMKELIRQPELANDLVGWITLGYHAYWREDLRPLAAEVIKMNRGAFAPWAVGLLERLDFIPHKQFEWGNYVALSNENL